MSDTSSLCNVRNANILIPSQDTNCKKVRKREGCIFNKKKKTAEVINEAKIMHARVYRNYNVDVCPELYNMTVLRDFRQAVFLDIRRTPHAARASFDILSARGRKYKAPQQTQVPYASPVSSLRHNEGNQTGLNAVLSRP